MGYSIKEAILYYIRSKVEGDMAVSVDESADIIGVGRRDGKIVPIIKPGSRLTATEIMQQAGIEEEPRPRRGVRLLGDLPISFIPTRRRKPRDRPQ